MVVKVSSSSEAEGLAQRSFVSAVARALRIQEQILQLQVELQAADQAAENSNEAAFRELGFDEATAPEHIFKAQRSLLERAVAEAELPESSPVAKAALSQIDRAEQAYQMALAQEGASLGGFQGPAL